MLRSKFILRSHKLSTESQNIWYFEWHFVTCSISFTKGYKCFPAGCCHSNVGNFSLSLDALLPCRQFCHKHPTENGKIKGPNLFAHPSLPQDRVKLVMPPPPFRGWKPFVAPSPVWLKLQATMLKLPQNFLCPPPPQDG